MVYSKPVTVDIDFTTLLAGPVLDNNYLTRTYNTTFLARIKHLRLRIALNPETTHDRDVAMKLMELFVTVVDYGAHLGSLKIALYGNIQESILNRYVGHALAVWSMACVGGDGEVAITMDETTMEPGKAAWTEGFEFVEELEKAIKGDQDALGWLIRKELWTRAEPELEGR